MAAQAAASGARRIGDILARYRKARARRAPWEAHWRECYAYALPGRDAFAAGGDGARHPERLFDGTAADAVDQLAAALLGQLTPPWSRWFGLALGAEVPPARRGAAAIVLERSGDILQSHFDRSNFAVEMHQCYLDLVTGGTACLLLEEAGAGSASALRFTSVPLAQAVLEEGPDGRLDTTFRSSEYTLGQLRSRYPSARLPEAVSRAGSADADRRFPVVEAVLPEQGRYRYSAVLAADELGQEAQAALAEGWFEQSPFISFRWLKAPGESYGRSPVMKALPDIKTANKVVELILKNASIAVTGIWQADDDGVLNPANIRLVPGTIIPKAVGSAGLTPLQSPGRFDISELVLDDLRGRIRHALLADRLGQVEAPRMTATEVLERSAEMSRLLGASFGRLHGELLVPLLTRAVRILQRRGELPPFALDGRQVELRCQSPLARQQAYGDVQNALLWLEKVALLGEEAAAVVDAAGAARWLAHALGVPDQLVMEPGEATKRAGLGIDPAPADPLAVLRALDHE